MASQKKCKQCGVKNQKSNKACSNCGTSLYKDVSYNVAIRVTIILDIIMAVVYILSIFILKSTVSNFDIENLSYVQTLPALDSLGYYTIILFFVVSALVKVLFVLNHYALKTNIFIHIRRVFMFVECVFMFPFQTIMALYFYNPATKIKK